MLAQCCLHLQHPHSMSIGIVCLPNPGRRSAVFAPLTHSSNPALHQQRFSADWQTTTHVPLVAGPSTAHCMTCNQSWCHSELRPSPCHTVTVNPAIIQHSRRWSSCSATIHVLLEQRLPLLGSRKSFPSALLSSQHCLSLLKLSFTAPHFSILRGPFLCTVVSIDSVDQYW